MTWFEIHIAGKPVKRIDVSEHYFPVPGRCDVGREGTAQRRRYP